MKIAIGTHIVDGPWGGGNRFAKSLTDYLNDHGWEVMSDLEHGPVDLILLTEPRRQLTSSAFGVEEISAYLSNNKKVPVVHRINECDERKGTTDVNDVLMAANDLADYTIFISDWLKALFQKYKSFGDTNSAVVRNGADAKIFNRDGYEPWDGHNPVKLVTHHWGGNWMKGFDIYQILDDMLDKPIAGHKVEFTYIGNIPQDFQFKHTTLVEPITGLDLAAAIKQNHIYITGSQNEPGGMHHIEGCLCGLPPIYRISGALTEHCRDFGVGFNGPEDFLAALETMLNNYPEYEKKTKNYPYTSDFMCSQYLAIFEKLIAENNAD